MSCIYAESVRGCRDGGADEDTRGIGESLALQFSSGASLSLFVLDAGMPPRLTTNGQIQTLH